MSEKQQKPLQACWWGLWNWREH